ncbi:hypothetical protein D3C71_2018840 [compost metagenome]
MDDQLILLKVYVTYLDPKQFSFAQTEVKQQMNDQTVADADEFRFPRILIGVELDRLQQ